MIRPPFVFDSLALVAITVPVPMVHEDVHQRTGQQEEKWQEAQDVETVFIDD
jgi:hypothetical protein